MWIQNSCKSVHLNTHAREREQRATQSLLRKELTELDWQHQGTTPAPPHEAMRPDFPKPPFYSCLYPTLYRYLSTRPGFKQKLCALWTVTTKSSDTGQITLVHLHLAAAVR